MTRGTCMAYIRPQHPRSLEMHPPCRILQLWALRLVSGPDWAQQGISRLPSPGTDFLWHCPGGHASELRRLGDGVAFQLSDRAIRASPSLLFSGFQVAGSTGRGLRGQQDCATLNMAIVTAHMAWLFSIMRNGCASENKMSTCLGFFLFLTVRAVPVMTRRLLQLRPAEGTAWHCKSQPPLCLGKLSQRG